MIQDPENVFNKRIMDMMSEYQCTMREALEWDFEGFEFDLRGMDKDLLKDEFKFYMVKNYIPLNSDLIPFYTSIILGEQDFGLKKDKVK